MSRAAGKERRKQQVLTAVEDSIRAEGAVNFSMRELAEKASVSFATPFNLFGSKDDILVALFEKRISEQASLTADRARKGSAMESLLHIAVDSCDAYMADAELFRPLMQAVRAHNPQLSTVHEQAFEMWVNALKDCQTDRVISPTADIDQVGRRLHMSFRMAFWLWASEALDNHSFREHALYSTIACLLPALQPKGCKQIDVLLSTDKNFSS